MRREPKDTRPAPYQRPRSLDGSGAEAGPDDLNGLSASALGPFCVCTEVNPSGF